MGCWHKKDDRICSFHGAGFWIIQILASMLIFMLGMRYAIRKAAMPMIGYRFLKMLFKH